MGMNIFIPTLGRADKQVTLRQLPDKIRSAAFLLVDYSERGNYGDIPVVVMPEETRGIGAVRQFAIDYSLDHGCTKVLMMDDDLRFFCRRMDNETLLRKAEEEDLLEMFEAIEAQLDDYPLVGVAAREGANQTTEMMVENTRILRLLAYRADVLRRECIRFDRVPVMEDFDVALELLKCGYKNLVLNAWAQNQEGSGLSGGCSTYRTMEMQGETADRMAAMHPGIVKAVEKTTKGSFGGGTRKDVVIQWKKALGYYERNGGREKCEAERAARDEEKRQAVIAAPADDTTLPPREQLIKE